MGSIYNRYNLTQVGSRQGRVKMVSELIVSEELGKIGKYDIDIVDVQNTNNGKVIKCLDINWKNKSKYLNHMFMNREQIKELYYKISYFLEVTHD